MTPDVRWEQRFSNFERALVLLREPMERDVGALEGLYQWLLDRRSK